MTKRILLVGIFCLTVLVAGCSGGAGDLKLGLVTGTITLDGEPVEGAVIEFTPVGEGRPSAGESDTSGTYTLYFKGSTAGALVGEHEVSMTTFQESMDYGGAEGFTDIPGRAEKIPKKYVQEKIRVTVEPGSNTINLDLKSDK